MSTDISRGVAQSGAVAAAEAYTGNLNGLEIAATFDATTGTFHGRVKNEAGQPLCDTRVAVILDGTQVAGETIRYPVLDAGERANFTLVSGGANFAEFQAQAETFTCDAIPAHGAGGEGGSEGGGESGGGEGGSEGGSEGGAGGGDAAEQNPTTPVSRPRNGTLDGLDYTFAYDRATNAFRGTVTNSSNTLVCGSRMEVHMQPIGQPGAIEIGPTIGVDLAPGENLAIVLFADQAIPETYSLHPERTPCP